MGIIREATIEDLPEIVRMGLLFCEQAELEPDVDSLIETVHDLLDADLGILLIGDGAMAGALAYPMYMNRTIIAAQEMFWWVDEDKRAGGAGKALMTALEEWAKRLGAKRMTMIGLESSPAYIDGFYRKNGYLPLEISYWKDL